jgi:hypothetical protein
MLHNELLNGIKELERLAEGMWGTSALRAVVELHKPELDGLICGECTASESEWYPCSTIQTIEGKFNIANI